METGTALLPLAAGQNHLALICGLPASLTYFAADLCRDLLARRHGACEVVNVNDLSADTIERIAAISGPALFLAEVPDAGVAAMAREAEFPIVVIDEGFAEACKDFMAARGAGLLDTARTMARANMGLRALADIPRATVIAADGDAPAAVLADRLAVALGIAADIAGDMVTSRDLVRPLSDVMDEIFVYPEMPGSDEADRLLAALGRFYDLQDHPEAGAWDLPLELLLEAAPPHHSANNTIDLVGPARCLTVGPYLYLPAGRWALRLAFSAAENVSSNTLIFDLTADNAVKFSQTYLMTTSGKFEFSCRFEIEDAFHPFEFRTFLGQGAIEGKLSLLSLVLERG